MEGLGYNADNGTLLIASPKVSDKVFRRDNDDRDSAQSL